MNLKTDKKIALQNKTVYMNEVASNQFDVFMFETSLQHSNS